MKQFLLIAFFSGMAIHSFSQRYYEATLVSVECDDYCILTLSNSDQGFFVDDFDALNAQFPALFTINEYRDYVLNPKYEKTVFYVLTATRSFTDDNGTVRQEYVVRMFKK